MKVKDPSLDADKVVRLKQHPKLDRREDGTTEDALALRFASRHESELRYVPNWGKWMRWIEYRWQLDGRLRAFELARDICREAVNEIPPGSRSKAPLTLRQAKTRAAVENLARSDSRLVAVPEQFDADRWRINTPSLVINLRDNSSSEPSREDYMTKATLVAPDVLKLCPLWRRFLEDITAGDKDLQAYLARCAGYWLTGVTHEHALFFLYGTGGNGKGTFLNTIMAILGDYAMTVPIEVLIASPVDRHPTEIAMLAGVRLAVASETEEGRAWAESRIKSMTGGDPLRGRFMRQDFFEFIPAFKLVVVGNHKPRLRNIDEAMRRRLHLIPFKVKIPAKKRDPELANKLIAEYPGILQWMLDGVVDWREQGLNPPAIVTAATDDYFRDEDAVATWLDDCCERKADAELAISAAFPSWCQWCERNAEPIRGQRHLRDELAKNGFEPCRIGHKQHRGFRGLKLTTAEVRRPDDDDRED